MADYSWVHCSIKDGSIIGISNADTFDMGKLSSEMKRYSFHVKINLLFSEAKTYHDEVLEDVEVLPGTTVTQVKHKYRYLIDMNTFFSADTLALIKDKNIEVETNDTVRPVSIILERL